MPATVHCDNNLLEAYLSLYRVLSYSTAPTLLYSVCRESTILCVSSEQLQFCTGPRHKVVITGSVTFVPESGGKLPGCTYTFVNAAPDGDEGVGQSAAASAVLRLKGRIVAEDPLDVET